MDEVMLQQQDELADSSEFVNLETHGDVVGQAIEQCNRWVIRPYKSWLKVIGWYNFTDNPSRPVKMLRLVWVVFIVMVIVAALCTQILSCFRRDQFKLVKLSLSNGTNGSRTQEVIRCNVSVVSIFVLPDVLLLITYFYGIYLFWRGQEYLQNLAEQVFVQCAKFTSWPEPLPIHLTTVIFLYLVLGVCYILASLIVRIIHASAFDLLRSDVPVNWPDNGPQFEGGGKQVLVIFSLFGFIFFDGVYIAAVINYAIQSELNIYLLHALRIKVERKEHKDLDTAIKEINSAHNYLRVLNGKTATAVALILFNVGSAGLNGVISLADNTGNTLQTVSATITAILWCLLVVFPFIQAARVTSSCNRLLAVGHVIRGRPLQYNKTPQLDLDSFSTFTTVITLRAEIFGVPVFPWMGYLAGVTFMFVILVLCQTGTYWYSEWL